MPRIARVIYDNAICHIFNRGNAKQIIFHDDEDFEHFLDILAYYKEKYQFQQYHFCLMPNHTHFKWLIPKAKILSAAMHDISMTYTSYHHKKYNAVRYLWQGRFKNMIVTEDNYQMLLAAYIERNPVRAGLVERPENWKWSSYRFYAFDEPWRLKIKVGNEWKYINLVDENPIYQKFAQTPSERQKVYQKFVETFNDEEVKKQLGLIERPRGRPRK